MPQFTPTATKEPQLRAYDPMKGDTSLDRPVGFYEQARDPLDAVSKLMTGLETAGVTNASLDIDTVMGALWKFIRATKAAEAMEFDVLKELPRYGKWLNKQLKDVGGPIRRETVRLGSGGEASVLNIEGTDDVLKIFPYGMPDYLQRTLVSPPPQLLPIKKWGATGDVGRSGQPFGYAVQERGIPFGGNLRSTNSAEYLEARKKLLDLQNQLGEGLAKHNYRLVDPHHGNIGYSLQGQPAVLDIGSIIDQRPPVHFVPFSR